MKASTSMESVVYKQKALTILLFLLIFFTLFVSESYAWHDKTHLAAAKAAGYEKWYNATGADITKIKAGSTEKYNHYFDNPSNGEVTPEMVLDQVRRYNNPNHEVGHLYGAIIASLREYVSAVEEGKYAAYHLAFASHYVTDLSQPLHNVPYYSFNRKHHSKNDGTVEKEVLDNINKIKKHMYTIRLSSSRFEHDLASEIARIANLSRQLAVRLKKENRDMTKEEAYIQLGHSASLLKAVLQHFENINVK